MTLFLTSVNLLYLLFFATIVHLGYFIILKETQSLVIFCLSTIFVYLIIPNMIVVLALALLFVDLLYLVQYFYRTHEGFSNTVKFKDLSGSDITANDFIESTMKSIQNKMPPDPPRESNTLEEVDEQSKKMSDVIEKIKSVTPEMMDSIKTLNSIDISELNKLINNMSEIVKTVSTDED